MYQINHPARMEPKFIFKQIGPTYQIETQTCVNGEWKVDKITQTHAGHQEISPLLMPCIGLFALWVFTALYAFAVRRRARIAEGKYKLLKGVRVDTSKEN